MILQPDMLDFAEDWVKSHIDDDKVKVGKLVEALRAEYRTLPSSYASLLRAVNKEVIEPMLAQKKIVKVKAGTYKNNRNE